MREPSNDNRTRLFLRSDGLLKREDFNLQNMDWLRTEMEKRNMTTLSPEECEANRVEMLKKHSLNKDLWVFGYGSLIWNPAIDIAESAPAKLTGWRRSFCIDMLFGRGSPQRPGLMLALDKGGECRGIAHCITADKIESETPILWLREMMMRTYRPVWAEAEIEGQPAEVLAFVIDQDTHLYAGNLEPSIQARRIATAEGALGSNRDDLYNCAGELKRREISDVYIEDLAARTRALAQDRS